MRYGVLPPNYIHQGNEEILLIQDNVEIPLNVKELFKSDSLFESLSKWFEGLIMTTILRV